MIYILSLLVAVSSCVVIVFSVVKYKSPPADSEGWCLRFVTYSDSVGFQQYYLPAMGDGHPVTSFEPERFKGIGCGDVITAELFPGHCPSGFTYINPGLEKGKE